MDEPAFEELYRATAAGLRTYLYRVCGERRVVDDLVQEAYYRLLRSKFASENHEEVVRYLFRIATNLLKDHWAAAKKERGGTVKSEPLAAGPSPSTRLDVHSALGALRPADREILWLAYAEGYSHAEIAGIAGLKAGSVRVMLFRARERLVRILRPNAKGESR
ncbi:MAG TPA: RNA polymerase sigma factor [Thermoanaerobaculia bacterium]|jgi:RNA polymerase sigma-70 factor (ECF subfamily)|nr:RNA polymerase sigma factor [Thermoanaerobaculia bacterium]